MQNIPTPPRFENKYVKLALSAAAAFIASQTLTSCGKPPQEIECVKLSPEKIELQRNEAIKDIQEMIKSELPVSDLLKVIDLEGEHSTKNEFVATDDIFDDGLRYPFKNSVIVVEEYDNPNSSNCAGIKVGIILNIKGMEGDNNKFYPQYVSDKVDTIVTGLSEKYDIKANGISNPDNIRQIASAYNQDPGEFNQIQEKFYNYTGDKNDKSNIEVARIILRSPVIKQAK